MSSGSGTCIGTAGGAGTAGKHISVGAVHRAAISLAARLYDTAFHDTVSIADDEFPTRVTDVFFTQLNTSIGRAIDAARLVATRIDALIARDTTLRRQKKRSMCTEMSTVCDAEIMMLSDELWEDTNVEAYVCASILLSKCSEAPNAVLELAVKALSKRITPVESRCTDVAAPSDTLDEASRSNIGK